MKLADWMKTNHHTDASLAALVDRDRTTVLRWRKREARPDWEALEKLTAATAGEVGAADFMEAAE